MLSRLFPLVILVCTASGCTNVEDTKLKVDLRASSVHNDTDLGNAAQAITFARETLQASKLMGGTSRDQVAQDALDEYEESVGLSSGAAQASVVDGLESGGKYDGDGGFTGDRTLHDTGADTLRSLTDTVWDELNRGTLAGYRLPF